MIQPTPGITRPYLWPEALMELGRKPKVPEVKYEGRIFK